ncbi:hypothetical protein [Cellulomonas denverensis]|uniref:ABC transporter permease n=1 Tax=Cellulomonas denverensis TaxID=264297 RepID=A0A7X6KUE0_9CELL|nr:hypothetical protein [Cellulomonas denverensis]NKY22260.1 hypothetical protein [Cellulomonas denverensis]
MAALALALAIFRFVTTSADTAGAVRAAEQEAAELSAMFGDLTTPAQTFVEPRYVFAGQFPHDLAGFLVGCAVLALVGGALLAGGDWRNRMVGTARATRDARSATALARVAVWSAGSLVVALLAALLVIVLAVIVAGLHGTLSGVDYLGTALMVARGVLLVAAGAAAGVALGTLLRSDVAVVVLLLGYVLIVETLMPVLSLGFRTPAALLHGFLRSEDHGRAGSFVCDVPRCAEPVLAGAGAPGGYALLVGVLVLACGVAWWGARRPVWR